MYTERSPERISRKLIRLFFASVFFCLVIWLVSFCLIWQVRDYTFEITHRLLTEDQNLNTKAEIADLLSRFERVKGKDLPPAYRQGSGISDKQYRKVYRNASFYVVPRSMLYTKVAGSTRIRDLVSRDEFFRATLFDRSTPIYWRIDEGILGKIIELRQTLVAQGYNAEGFRINHGFRTPRYNERVGGASQSRHLYGEAVDMTILDVNNDGKYSAKDKDIILDILEHTVIRSGGGIGLYPGTRTVHMDVRGYRARWDSY